MVSGDLVLNGDASAPERWLPAGSAIAVVASIVYVVLSLSADAGTSATCRSPSEKAKVTGTAVPAVVSRSDAAVTVDRLIGSEKRTVSAASSSTADRPAAGVTKTTSGETTSRTVTVTGADSGRVACRVTRRRGQRQRAAGWRQHGERHVEGFRS